MAVVSDYTMIVGDTPKNIGGGVVELPFDTGGRHQPKEAFLIFSVKGLNTVTPVKVNNVEVGKLQPNPTQGHWYTQMVYMTGSQLNNGANELQLEAVGVDNFQIRQVTCFFGQDV
jgi:hypothetical protein